MKKEDLFAVDRGERAHYESAGTTDEVRLPVTRDGFETLIELVAKNAKLPVELFDPSVRSVFVGYVHHIDREKNTTTIEMLTKVLTKSISNALTWTIDQEIKMKAQEELQAARAKAQAEADEKAKEAALAKAEEKREKKTGKKITMKSKPNEAKAN